MFKFINKCLELFSKCNLTRFSHYFSLTKCKACIYFKSSHQFLSCDTTESELLSLIRDKIWFTRHTFCTRINSSGHIMFLLLYLPPNVLAQLFLFIIVGTKIKFQHSCFKIAIWGYSLFLASSDPTVWKFQAFSIIQISREINHRHSRNSITAVFCGTELCWFGKFQPSKSTKIHKKQNSESLNLQKCSF